MRRRTVGAERGDEFAILLGRDQRIVATCGDPGRCDGRLPLSCSGSGCRDAERGGEDQRKEGGGEVFRMVGNPFFVRTCMATLSRCEGTGQRRVASATCTNGRVRSSRATLPRTRPRTTGFERTVMRGRTWTGRPAGGGRTPTDGLAEARHQPMVGVTTLGGPLVRVRVSESALAAGPPTLCQLSRRSQLR